jgi:hypothetical protein
MIELKFTGTAHEILDELALLGFRRDDVVLQVVKTEAKVPVQEATIAEEPQEAPASVAAEPAAEEAPKRRGRPPKATAPAPAEPLDDKVEEAEIVPASSAPADTPAEPAEEWDYAKVRSLLISVHVEKGKDDISRRILDHFGVKKLSDLDPKHYPEAVKMAREA